MKTKSATVGMNTPKSSIEPAITDVAVSAHLLTVTLNDGRIVSTPVSWYPRLRDATQAQRSNWKIIGSGIGVNWPDVDEDLSLQGMLDGRVSMDLIRERNQLGVPA